MRSLRSRRRLSSASTTVAGGRSRVRPRGSRWASASASASRAKAWPVFSPRSTRRSRRRAKRARLCCASTSRRGARRSDPAIGRPPLPPYIASRRAVTESDRTDYQTMFAAKPGAVAAPTAGLHFTPALVARLDARGVALHRVTLHVGAGTFMAVKVEDTGDHKMQSEWGSIDAATAEALNAVENGEAGLSASARPRRASSRAPLTRRVASSRFPAKRTFLSVPDTASASSTRS